MSDCCLPSNFKLHMRFCVFVFLILPLFCLGQSQRDSLKTYRFTVSPSAFMNTSSGIQVGIERKALKKDYVELEFAYLFPVRNNLNFKSSGYRIKAGFKIQNLDQDVRTTFIFFFRETNSDRLEDFSRFDDLYFQQIEFQKTKRLFGFTVGFLKELTYESVIMQLGASAGPGRYFVKDKGVPDNADQISGLHIFSFYERPGEYFFPIISIQWKFIF